MIKIESLRKRYKKFDLGPIDLNIEDGEYFVLLGVSGAGKSLLLELISGLQKADSGKIIIDGINANSIPIQKRNIGFVFQNNALFPHMTVEKNIFFSLSYTSIKREEKRISKTITTLGIENILTRYPETLSAGEGHRVAIARTLITNPKYILLDEPLSSLDNYTKYETRSLLRKINSGTLLNKCGFPKEKKTIVHVTHDYEEALALSSKIGVVENGKIIQVGKAEDVFKKPKSEFVAKFIGVKNFYKGTLLEKEKSCYFILKNNKEIKFTVSAVSTYQMSEDAVAIIKSENVILSLAHLNSSARNIFKGVVREIEKVGYGFELKIYIDKEFIIYSKITVESYLSMKVKEGQEIFVNFKASAVELV